MSRTFFVKFNIDAFRSCLADLDGQPDSAYREWMRGFNRGVNGKQPTDEAGSLRAGMAMGWESYSEAQDYRAKQAEKGRQSADARRGKQGTAQPNPNHGSTTVQPRIEPDTEPDTEPSNIEHPTSTNENPETIFCGPHFPTKAGVGYRLPRNLYDTMASAYPGVDLDLELNKASAWLMANTSRQKTAKGMPRFINAWLQRCVPAQPAVPVEDDGPTMEQTLECAAEVEAWKKERGMA